MKPGAKTNSVEKQADGSYRVSVKAPPVEGKANAAVIAALAEHFGVPKSSVVLRVGAGGKRKGFEILL